MACSQGAKRGVSMAVAIDIPMPTRGKGHLTSCHPGGLHDGSGDSDVLHAEDDIRYYTGDANHNVTATIDASTGDVVERFVYTAYGTATVYDADWSTPVAPTTDGPLYCGYFLDSETALYHVRNRYYNSSLSTFITRDPLGHKGGINLYEYVGNSPLRGTDPAGKAPPDAGDRIVDYCRRLKCLAKPGGVDEYPPPLPPPPALPPPPVPSPAPVPEPAPPQSHQRPIDEILDDPSGYITCARFLPLCDLHLCMPNCKDGYENLIDFGFYRIWPAAGHFFTIYTCADFLWLLYLHSRGYIV